MLGRCHWCVVVVRVNIVVVEVWMVVLLSSMESVALLLVVILLLRWLMFHTLHFCRRFIVVGVVIKVGRFELCKSQS